METIDRTCPICKTRYQADPTRLKTGRDKTCSRKCSYVLRGRLTSFKQQKSLNEFVAQARTIHGSTYDYAMSDYRGAHHKVCIRCPDHGLFWQTPDHHLNQKSGCPQCANIATGDAQRYSQESILARFSDLHGNKYDYSQVRYKTSHDGVAIGCPTHGLFYQSPDVHLRGCGCPKCGRERTTAAQLFDLRLVVGMMKSVHGDFYDYSNVVYTGSQEKVVIVCPKHGEFHQTPNKHCAGQGCPECGKRRRADLRRKTTVKFIEEAKSVHGPKYDYTSVNYLGDALSVTIRCPHHGLFEQLPTNHLKGRGCSSCRYEKNAQNFSFTKEEWIRRAVIVHGAKYDYSGADYKNSQTKVTIGCPTHGHFRQRPNGHLRGKGCPKCGVATRANKHRLTHDNVVERMIAVHGPRYDYSAMCYESAHTKVTIICCKHGPFRQTPNSHVQGAGCPRCSESTGESAIRFFLESRRMPYSQEHRIRHIGFFDFVTQRADGIVCIEFHGGQHYRPCDFGSKKPFAKMKALAHTIRRDLKKEQWCKAKRIPLLVIPYWDYDRIEEILSSFLAGDEPVFSDPPEIVKKYERTREKIIERLAVAP